MKLTRMAGWVVIVVTVGYQALAVEERHKTSKTHVAEFRQGVAGYKHAFDTEIWALAPNTILESNPNASSDANNDGGESQVLLKFDQVFGNAPGQVPLGSRIIAARLEVSAFDQGSTVHLHRMLVPFTASATWNSLVAGVSADGLEASRHKDSLTFGKIAANTSIVHFDVTILCSDGVVASQTLAGSSSIQAATAGTSIPRITRTFSSVPSW